MKALQNAQVGFNDIMLEQAEQQLQTMVESASMSLHCYPVTPQLHQYSGEMRIFYPVMEPSMLQYPLLRPFIQYQTYLCNVLRQQGNVDDALTIAKNLIGLAMPAYSKTVSSIFTMMSAPAENHS